MDKQSEVTSPYQSKQIRKFEVEQNDFVDKFNISSLEPRKSLSQPKNSDLKISFHEASGLGVTKVTTDNEGSKVESDQKPEYK